MNKIFTITLLLLVGLNILGTGVIIGKSGKANANEIAGGVSIASGSFIATTKLPDSDKSVVPEGVHTAWIRKNNELYYCQSTNNSARTLKCKSVLVEF